MPNAVRYTVVVCAVLLQGTLGSSFVVAQPDKTDVDASTSDSNSQRNDVSTIASRQRILLDNYNELEQLLLQMAEYLGAEDPRRAALLRKAFQLSSENSTRQRLEELVEMLARDDRASTLRTAGKSQQQVQTDLDALLKLLMSENRDKQNRDEQRRIRKYLQRVNKVIRKQRAITDQTRRSEPKEQSERQGKLADETGGLQRELSEDPATTAPDQDGESPQQPANLPDKPGGENPPKSGGDQPKDAKDPHQPGDAEPMPGGQPPGNSAPKASGEKPAPSAEPKRNPAAERLKDAQQKMREAQQDLKKARRDGAIEKQQEALRKLEQAKAELERILRLLRLEEDEQQLELLEARFKAILKLERKVYEGTRRLDGVEPDERDADDEIEAARLARSQNEIIADVEKALLLLHEEGSAVAMTEIVTQMRDDMQQISNRLSKQQTGELTQSIEEDVLASLEEILAALDKAIQDNQERKQGGQSQPGTPQDPPLVDTIAELKMLRSMQIRVRRRTSQYNKMLGEETSQATKPDLLESLKRLSDRQDRIFRATRDIASGKNQ